MVRTSRLLQPLIAGSLVLIVVILLVGASTALLIAPHAHVQTEELTRTRIPGVRTLGSTINDEAVIAEQRFQRDAESLWGPAAFAGQIYDSFTSGGNVVFSASQYLYRKFASGPTDPTFDQKAYIEEHRGRIPDDQLYRLMGTTNRQEADWLLSDYEDSTYKQRRIEARGVLSGQVAWSIASGIAPLIALALLMCWRRYGRRPAVAFEQNKQISPLPSQDMPRR